MINGKVLHEDFRYIVNRKNTGWNENIEPYELDSYLNRSLHTYFKNRVILAETNSEARNDIRELELKKQELKKRRSGDECDVYYLPNNLYKLMRHYALVYTKECCKVEKTRRLDIRIPQSDDLNELLKSPNWAPSYDWEETLADEGADGLFIWHNGCFCIKNVIVDYYRKPLDIRTPSAMAIGYYEDAEGKRITKDVGLELTATYQKDYIVELAAAYFFRDMGDSAELDSMLKTINYTEGYLIQN